MKYRFPVKSVVLGTLLLISGALLAMEEESKRVAASRDPEAQENDEQRDLTDPYKQQVLSVLMNVKPWGKNNDIEPLNRIITGYLSPVDCILAGTPKITVCDDPYLYEKLSKDEEDLLRSYQHPRLQGRVYHTRNLKTAVSPTRLTHVNLREGIPEDEDARWLIVWMDHKKKQNLFEFSKVLEARSAAPVKQAVVACSDEFCAFSSSGENVTLLHIIDRVGTHKQIPLTNESEYITALAFLDNTTLMSAHCFVKGIGQKLSDVLCLKKICIWSLASDVPEKVKTIPVDFPCPGKLILSSFKVPKKLEDPIFILASFFVNLFPYYLFDLFSPYSEETLPLKIVEPRTLQLTFEPPAQVQEKERLDESPLVEGNDNQEGGQPNVQQRSFWRDLLRPPQLVTGVLMAVTGTVLLYKYLWQR